MTSFLIVTYSHRFFIRQRFSNRKKRKQPEKHKTIDFHALSKKKMSYENRSNMHSTTSWNNHLVKYTLNRRFKYKTHDTCNG